jgi:hypothetical protein
MYKIDHEKQQKKFVLAWQYANMHIQKMSQ